MAAAVVDFMEGEAEASTVVAAAMAAATDNFE
jgi:hypothetical protein